LSIATIHDVLQPLPTEGVKGNEAQSTTGTLFLPRSAVFPQDLVDEIRRKALRKSTAQRVARDRYIVAPLNKLTNLSPNFLPTIIKLIASKR
jgi:hypothetical protein